MKKILTIITLAIFTLTSCSSDDGLGTTGPQGPPGEPGEDGLIGTVFEAEPINFTAENEFSELVEIPVDIEVFDSDVILVYRLEAVIEDTGDDVWTLLPQTFYLDNGELEYNYNFTSENVVIFLDGNLDLTTLNTDFTENQIFRIVVVPAGFPEESAVDVSNYHAVMSALEAGNKALPLKE